MVALCNQYKPKAEGLQHAAQKRAQQLPPRLRDIKKGGEDVKECQETTLTACVPS